ncbi:hypothetical protein NOI24_16310 [Neorhizobium galegae]|uniref:hypothetical protein n=1 Tax=Neorhizobium galegae TaxID=399 RepID=UPI0021039E2A|nr:hypothetical protein [Neorhizobium galegae]MCQ1772874.1 hypothetical protein [Neorhizobium galegae]MCQ1799179.1 hypothetical protein [Neorhizobium galegae]
MLLQQSSSKAGAMADPPKVDTQNNPHLMNALGDLLNLFESKVLAAIGLLSGYLCIFFTQWMAISSGYVIAVAMSLLTGMLLMLNPEFKFNEFKWWLRTFTVIIVALFLTSPQVVFALKSAAADGRDAAEAQALRAVTTTSGRGP